jgi:hypothetical protein
MPRREKDWKLARRRKRKKEKRKLSAMKETVKEAGKKPERAASRPKEVPQEGHKAVNEPAKPEG